MRCRPWLLAALLLAGACSGGGSASRSATSEPASTTSTTVPATVPATATTAAPQPSPPGSPWGGPVQDGPVKAVVAAGGVVVPVEADNGEGMFTVTTPCSSTATVTGAPLRGADVVLDPGHGGVEEPGAQGPTGLLEKDVNLPVAEEVRDLLAAQGASVVLTRTTDQNTTIATRAEIATKLQPRAFVSIHHNAEPDGPSTEPGNESYYQIASASSKRLSGLIWEEITAVFSPFGSAWEADTDHGAKYREGTRGDYYGILRLAAGVPTVLSEAAFISDPAEEALLRTPEFRHAEAQAIANALTRFVTTDDPGAGFVTPYPRTEPAGGGGGPEGCTDPPL